MPENRYVCPEKCTVEEDDKTHEIRGAQECYNHHPETDHASAISIANKREQVSKLNPAIQCKDAKWTAVPVLGDTKGTSLWKCQRCRTYDTKSIVLKKQEKSCVGCGLYTKNVETGDMKGPITKDIHSNV